MSPPLVPAPDEARSALRRELLRPEYHDQDLLPRLWDRVARFLDRLLGATSATPGASALLAMLVLVVLVLALGLLLSRARRTARAGGELGGVLGEEPVRADELAARARAALAQGRHEDAVVEGFRALALRQVELGRLEAGPGATAHEVGAALAGAHPAAARRVRDAADLFEQVLYGERRAAPDRAADVVALDDELAGAAR